MAVPRPLLFALQDSLMLLAPRGWTQVELELSTAPQLRVTGLSTKGEGAKAPKPKPQLAVDAREEAARLSEALAELQPHLSGWVPGKVLVERKGGFVDWKFLRADGGVASFTRLESHELDSLLITDALFDALEGTERAFHDLQGQLQQRLGRVRGFGFDAKAGVLKLERDAGAIELDAEVVGSYLPEVFTWAWGWADEGADPASTVKTRGVCAPDVKPPGLAALWRGHFHCDEGFAWALAGHVAVSIGARGLFRAQPPGAEGALFFAILELPPG
ncbi:MAG: hypothetical protein U0228_20845 [Myxococcaceae bacterium]